MKMEILILLEILSEQLLLENNSLSVTEVLIFSSLRYQVLDHGYESNMQVEQTQIMHMESSPITTEILISLDILSEQLLLVAIHLLVTEILIFSSLNYRIQETGYEPNVLDEQV